MDTIREAIMDFRRANCGIKTPMRERLNGDAPEEHQDGNGDGVLPRHHQALVPVRSLPGAVPVLCWQLTFGLKAAPGSA